MNNTNQHNQGQSNKADKGLFGGGGGGLFNFGANNSGGGLFSKSPNTDGSSAAPPVFTATGLFGSNSSQAGTSLFGLQNKQQKPAAIEVTHPPPLFGGMSKPGTSLFQNSNMPSFFSNKPSEKAETSTPLSTTPSLFGGLGQVKKQIKNEGIFSKNQSVPLFGGKIEDKKIDQKIESKNQPKLSALFGSGQPSMFGNTKPQSQFLNFGGSKQASTIAQPLFQNKTQQKKQENKQKLPSFQGGSLFNGTSNPTSGLFGQKKPENIQTQANVQSKSPKNDSLKLGTTALFFGEKKETQITNNDKDKKGQIKIGQSLFGNNNNLEANNSINGGKQSKVPLFGGATGSLFSQPPGQPTSLFGSQPGNSNQNGNTSNDNKQLNKNKDVSGSQVSFGGSSSFFSKPQTKPTQLPSQNITKTQQNKSIGALSGLFSKPVESSKPLETNTLPQATTKLDFSKNKDIEVLGKSSLPLKKNDQGIQLKQPSTEKQKQFSFTMKEEIKQPQIAPRKATQISQQAQKQKQSISTSNRMTQSILFNRTQTQTKQNTTVTVNKQGERTLFSVVKPRQIASKDILDYKSIKQEEKIEGFNNFVTQSKDKIIDSVKLYFTTRKQPYKQNQIQPANDKQRFLNDFTNLLVKILGLAQSSFRVVNKFVRNIIKDERYEQKLFKGDNMVIQYFQVNQIYWKDYKNQYALNEINSRQLQLLVSKFINKWFIEKIGLLGFLIRYPDLFRNPSDLFNYLLKHLLTLSSNNVIEMPHQFYTKLLSEYQLPLKQKLIEVINYYNKKINANYVMNTNNQDIFGIIQAIQVIHDDQVIKIALRVLLSCIDLQHIRQSHKEERTKQIIQKIKGSKGMGMLPLRTVMNKFFSKSQQFIPSPNDLYRYVSGDEWIDWFDLYLSDPKEGREVAQLQANQPQKIISSLCNINGKLLLDRMLILNKANPNKGIHKFFSLLRDENMVNLYYKLLQACIYDENSIRSIEQFYFKKMYFNLQYQQIIEYIINFNQNLGKQHVNQEGILLVLQAKISLLVKILEIQPERVTEVQKLIFNHESNKNKRFKASTVNNGTRDGEKLIHLFIDIINIVSVKNISNKILSKIFKLLTNLIRSKNTQNIVLSAIKVNKPSFNFTDQIIHRETLQYVNEFLQCAISGNYLYDLMISYNESKQDQLRSEELYPLRFSDIEYTNLCRNYQSHGHHKVPHFSIYWFSSLINVINKQRFNPYLIDKLLQKLYIIPYDANNEMNSSSPFYYYFKKHQKVQAKLSPILENVINVLNSISIWQQIKKIIEFKIIKNQGKITLLNKYLSDDQNITSVKTVLFTLKLIRTIFKMSQLLNKYQDRLSEHFIIKALSSIEILGSIKISTLFINNSSRNNLLLYIMTNIQPEQTFFNDCRRNIPWEAEEYESSGVQYILVSAFNQRFGKNVDFEQAHNFMKSPNNKYYENQQNIVTLSLQIIIFILKLCPQCSLEFSLTSFLPIKQQQKIQLKNDMIVKMIQSSMSYVKSRESPNISHRIMQYIYDLKYGLNNNKVNSAFSNKLFNQFIKTIKNHQKNVRLNSLIVKYIFNEIKQKSNEHYEGILEGLIPNIISTFQLKDSFLNNSGNLSDSKQVGRMLKRYHQKQYSLYNLNQMERIIEERAIIQIGEQFQLLYNILDYFILQISNKKRSFNLVNSLNSYNTLLARYKLILYEYDLPIEFKQYASQENQSTKNQQPRMYLRDPIELYLTETKNINKKLEVQLYQKNNILEWFLDGSLRLSGLITKYMKLMLTMNKYLYSNNPIQFSVDRQDIKNMELFSHLSLGKFAFTATQIFGKSTTDAVGVVQIVAQCIIDKLTAFNKMKRQQQIPLFQCPSYKEGLKIIGLCLEWLRNKQKTGENTAVACLIRKITACYNFLLPIEGCLIYSQSIKILLSALTINQKGFSPKAKDEIRQSVYTLLERYERINHKNYQQAESAQYISQLLQQAIPILLVIPPEKHQTATFEIIVNMWSKQTNFQYFFNESRLILQFCSIYPEEFVKLQLLSNCQIIQNISDIYSRYDGNERKLQSIAWLWVVKIATQLANNPLSILIVNQVGNFFKKYKNRFFAMLNYNQNRISKAHIEDLQAVLELLISLFSQSLWINFNTNLAEEITYILSHKLIKLFVLFGQNKLQFVISSANDKVLSQVRPFPIAQQQFSADNFDGINQQNLYQMQMKMKMNYCLRNYCILMQRAFRSSRYVQSYFDNYVFETNKYFTSFWDTFNKHLICLLNYCNKQFRTWLSVKKLNETIKFFNQCYNSPHTFVENGYLTCIIQIPRNEAELFSEIYLMNYLATQLATIHYLKQKLYITKHNTLLVNHSETFAKRLKEHIANLKVQSKKVSSLATEFIDQSNFDNLRDVLQNRCQ